jgi:hypothetical protein
MPRRLHLDDAALTVQLSGVLALAAMHRRVVIPWSAIAEARTDALALRRPRHGRFVHARRVSFLSFEDPARVVRLLIDRGAPGAPRLDEVVIGHAEPDWLARQVRRRLAAPLEAPRVSAPARAA